MYRRNARVLEIQNFTPLKGWTYVRKMLREPNFLTHGAPLHALRERESSAKYQTATTYECEKLAGWLNVKAYCKG